MADLIEIQIGDQTIRVPQWATEATLEAMLKYNEIAARALNKLVGVETDGKKTLRVQEHYFKSIVDELKKTKDKQEKLINEVHQDRKSQEKDSAAILKATQNLGNSSKLDNNAFFSSLEKLFEKHFGTSKSGGGSGGGTGGRTTPTGALQKRRLRLPRETNLLKDLTQIEKYLIEDPSKLEARLFNEVRDLLAKGGSSVKGFSPEQLNDIKKVIMQLQAGGYSDTERQSMISSLTDSIDNFRSHTREFTGLLDALMSKNVKEYYSINHQLEDVANQLQSSVGGIKKGIIDSIKSGMDGQLTDIFSSLSSIITNTGSTITTMVSYSFEKYGKTDGPLGKIAEVFTKVIEAIPFAGIIAGAASGAIASISFILSEYQKYATSLSDILNIGALQVGMNLETLRQQAGNLGLNVEQFAKIISSNGKAILALGKSTADGTTNFQSMANAIQVSLESVKQFGLGNEELMQAILEETEIRRLSGMSAAQITNELSSSMEKLLFETNTMAALTGQDARELRRKQLEQVKTDALVASYMMSTSNMQQREKMGMLSGLQDTERYGPLGPTIGKAMQAVIANPKFDIMTIPGMAEILSMPEYGPVLKKTLDDIIAMQRDTSVTSEQFTKELPIALGTLSNTLKTIPPETLKDLATVDTKYKETASNLLLFASALQGLPTNMADANQSIKDLTTAVEKNNDLGLGATIEDLNNTLKTSVLLGLINSAGAIKDFLGIDIAGLTPRQMVESLSNVMKTTTGEVKPFTSVAANLSGSAASSILDAAIGLDRGTPTRLTAYPENFSNNSIKSPTYKSPFSVEKLENRFYGDLENKLYGNNVNEIKETNRLLQALIRKYDEAN